MVGIGAMLTLVSCQQSTDDERALDQSAKAIGHAECALCGMVVREQPAPRGQVVHADGERVFLCSIGDLVMYLRMPSIHGSTLQSYVEVLEAETSLSGDLKKQWPWVFTQTASFVAGVDRKRSMGEPMLAYGDVEAARVSAEKHHGEVLGWQATFERLGR